MESDATQAMPGPSKRNRQPERERPLPEPTAADPGTWAKVEILRQRFESGQALWHPDDSAVPFHRGYRRTLIDGVDMNAAALRVQRARTMDKLGAVG